MKTFIKIFLLLAAVIGALIGISYYEDKHGTKYIDIYNEEDDEF